jgi:hypothetical protein
VEFHRYCYPATGRHAVRLPRDQEPTECPQLFTGTRLQVCCGASENSRLRAGRRSAGISGSQVLSPCAFARTQSAVPECLRRSRPRVRGAGNRGAARAFKMVPVAAGSVRGVTGIEPGRAGMLTGFAGLSTPLVADACIRRGVPLRVAPPGIGAVIPGADRRAGAARPPLRERRCVPGGVQQRRIRRRAGRRQRRAGR